MASIPLVAPVRPGMQEHCVKFKLWVVSRILVKTAPHVWNKLSNRCIFAIVMWVGRELNVKLRLVAEGHDCTVVNATVHPTRIFIDLESIVDSQTRLLAPWVCLNVNPWSFTMESCMRVDRAIQDLRLMVAWEPSTWLPGPSISWPCLLPTPLVAETARNIRDLSRSPLTPSPIFYTPRSTTNQAHRLFVWLILPMSTQDHRS